VKEVGLTPGADADMGGEVAVLVVLVTDTAMASAVIIVLAVILVGVVILVGGTEAWASKRLTETGGASFRATTRVMDTPDGSPAVLAGEVDDPARGLPLVPPTDGFERIATDGDGVGQAADPLPHIHPALWANGHDDSSFGPATSPFEVGIWL
jgi:hypothetical protein